MTRPAHEKALADWVELVLSPLGFSPTSYTDTGGTHPIGPYATVRVLSDVRLGQIDERTMKAGANTTHRYITQRAGTIEVQVIGAGHYDGATRLDDSIRQADVALLFETAGMTLLGSIGGITQLGTDSDGVLNNRSIITFEFSRVSSYDITDTEGVEEITTTETYT